MAETGRGAKPSFEVFELGSLKISRGSSFEKIYEWAELDQKLELSKKSELNSMNCYLCLQDRVQLNKYLYLCSWACLSRFG